LDGVDDMKCVHTLLCADVAKDTQHVLLCKYFSKKALRIEKVFIFAA
jgi:hypothetical protein